jgi:hypothetical protein
MKIQQTEDYSSFKRIEGNRTISKSQVKKLVDSYNEDPHLSTMAPIIVNDNMEVIDGQHRLEAFKKLDLPVNYMIIPGIGLAEVQKLNSATKTWTPMDYARSYSELGNENYKTYLQFRKKYGLIHQVAMTYLGGADGAKENTTYRFHRGKFVVRDVESAHKISGQLVDMTQYYRKGDARGFAYAFRKIALSPKYDHQRMIAKFQQKVGIFKDTPYVEENLRQLEKIYNHGCGQGNRVRLF